MKLTFDISATEFVTVRDILADIVPPGCRVWVFGSRAKNQARFNSDLDLAFEGKDKLPQIILHKLKEAFSDSPLPWRVDVLDINDVSEKFQTIIRQQAIIFPLAKSVKVPKLRFKDAQGKAFPDCEEKRLGDFYEFKSTNSLSRDNLNYDGGTVLNIHYGDIHTKFKPKFDLTKEYVPFINADVDLLRISADKYCGEGDLVIADASEDYDGIGKTIEIMNLNGKNVLAGLHTLLARLSSKEIHIGFGAFVMSCPPVRKQIKTIAQGTKVLGISARRMAKIKLTMPSLPEQQKIAACLSSVDSKIEQLSQKKSFWKHYKKGAMQKLFSQELRFKDANSNNFPDWVEKRLGEVVDIEMGQSPKSHSYNENQIGVPLIQGNADILNRLSAPRRYTSEPTKLCNVGDLLLSVRAPIGEVSLSQHDACIGRGVAAIRSRKKAILRFWFQFLLNYEPKWYRLGQGSTFSAISGSNIRNIKVFLPILGEQQKIADFLSAIDRKIDIITTELTHTQTFKKGLLQQMFV